MCKMHVPTNYISFGSPCGSAQDHHKLLEILDGYSIGEQGLDFPTFPDLVADICANGPIRRYVESIIERTATDANNNSSRRRKRGISINHLNSREVRLLVCFTFSYVLLLNVLITLSTY